MTSRTSRKFRAARDQLIDLLGFGETYPLRDLPVREERLAVSVGGTALIPIETSQADVFYCLRDVDTLGAEAIGNGETLLLETPPISKDVTFSIRARKRLTNRWVELLQTATVKEGLDAGLDAWIRPQVAPEPRIIDFGSIIEVEIDKSQEGVDYRLVHFPNGEPANPDSTDELDRDVNLSEGNKTVRGTGPQAATNIVLRSIPMVEDTMIRIRAIKTFDPSEGRTDQTTILAVPLPIYVRANPVLAVVVRPSPIVDYKTGAEISVAGTQASASYRAHARTVSDRDYRHGEGSWPNIVGVPETDVQVVGLPPAPQWDAPAGFAPVSDFGAGNGGGIILALTGLAGGTLTDDTLIVIEARKRHRLADGTEVISAVRLRQAAVILVRPDPNVSLRLEVDLKDSQTTGILRVFDGQPGVFYYFRSEPGGEAIDRPAYFHKRDGDDARFNKGIGQLALDVDFVVARDGRGDLATPPLPRDQAAPASPILATKPLPADVVLAIRAVKAQTRVTVELAPRPPSVAAPVDQ